TAAEVFFRRELAGLSAPTEIDAPRPVRRPAESDPHPPDRNVTIEPGALARLAELAKRSRLTLTTLVEGAWAALLGRYAADGGGDVVFGTTVSGRGAPLPGIESMVGLFINTLPVRAR